MLRSLVLVALALSVGVAAAQRPAATGTSVVAGQVIDSAGNKPVGGATVTLSISAPARANPPTTPLPPRPPADFAIASANAQGRFVFRDVPAGEYTLTADLGGYAPGATGRKRISGPARTFTVSDGARMIDANITVWRLAAISGIVRDDRGEPAVGVGVWGMRRWLNGGQWELGFAGGAGEATDERGYYRLSNLTPGSYVLVVRSTTQTLSTPAADAYYAARAAGNQSMLGTEWGQTGAIRFPGSGLAIDNWQVAVSNSNPPVLPGPNGTLLVHPTMFYANGRTTGEATALAILPGDDRTGIDLALPMVSGMRVSGTLSGPEGPAPSHGLRLLPVPASANDIFFDNAAAYATTDASGRFAFLGVPPGNYIVKAYRIPGAAMGRPGPPPPPPPPASLTGQVERTPPIAARAPSLFAEIPVTVGASHVDGLLLTLQPGARLSGRVRFEGAAAPPTSAQLARSQIQFRPLNGTAPTATAPIDAEGRLMTSGMAPGRYVLNFSQLLPAPWSLASARIGGADAAGQAFTVGASDITDVEIVFSDKVTTLSGTVRPLSSGGSTDAMVVMYPADVQGWIASGMSPRRVATAQTSPSGDYQIRVVLAGDYLVVAIPPDVAPDVDADFAKKFSPSAVRVTLAPGDAKVQSLVIK